ncbi:MAG: hypothetical protein ACREL6_05885, partial [Gemmatimonadales bacterium]
DEPEVTPSPATQPQPEPRTPAPEPEPDPEPATPPPPQNQATPATPVDTPAPTPSVAPAPLVLAAGTVIRASVNDSLNSRDDKPGQTLAATINTDVKDPNGRIIIPAGSTVNMTVSELKAAGNKSAEDGTLVLAVSSISVNGQDYPVDATIDSVEHYLKGRGVGTSEAAKVGAGAAAGAIAGRIIGGGKKGTIIGGIIGAAVGTGVAVETADRDVVVPAGALVVIRLTEELSVNRT